MGLTCLRRGCHKHSRGGKNRTKQNLRSWIKCVPVFLLSEGSAMPRGSHAPPAASTRPGAGVPAPAWQYFRLVYVDYICCGDLWSVIFHVTAVKRLRLTEGLACPAKPRSHGFWKPAEAAVWSLVSARPRWLCQRWSLRGHSSLQSRGPESEQEATQSTHVPSEGERAGFQSLCLGLRLESRGLIVTPEALA